jgi:ABC-type multidrug transport system fused ATPase/permease subunit
MLLHDKTIVMSHDVINKGSDAGKIINVATTDLDILEFVFILNSLWFSPMFFVVILVTIYFISGIAGIIGVLCISLLVPLQIYIGKLNVKLRIKVGAFSDTRIKLTTEIVDGIRVLKMYGWELAYVDQIKEKRRKEMFWHRIRGYIRATNMSLFLSA